MSKLRRKKKKTKDTRVATNQDTATCNDAIRYRQTRWTDGQRHKGE